MTVAIGLVCKDGVLVAADSMGSNEQMIASVSVKVHAFERSPVIWTSSGSVFVIEEMQTVLAQVDQAGSSDGSPLQILTTPNLPAIRNKLHVVINKKMGECYGKALSSTPGPPGGIHPSFVTDFLLLGYANETPWLLEFAHDGQVNDHTAKQFYAVGSGGPFAQVALSLMAHYIGADLTLELGMRLAYRTIDTTIRVSSYGVGPPVQIAICDGAGARVLDLDEVKAIADAVEGWKQLEAETLRRTPEEVAEAATGDLPKIDDAVISEHETPGGT